MRCFSLFLSFAILTSCHHRAVEYIEDDVIVQENRIDLIPIFNSTEQVVPWNVSDELTQLMGEMKCKNASFKVNETERWMNFEEVYQGVSSDLGLADFVVAADLIQHAVIPVENETNNTSVLVMKVHLIIFDLRQSAPYVIFNQIISSTHTIPGKYAFWNYSKNNPSSCHYKETPLSQAHAHLATILMEKIQEHAN